MITSNKKRHSVNKLSALSCPVLLAKLDKEIPRKHYKPLDISSLITLKAGFDQTVALVLLKRTNFTFWKGGSVQLRFI
jgi:hypothetical protein